MPLYDFECPRGHIFEKNVPYDDRYKPIPCEVEIEVREISLEQLADSLEEQDALKDAGVEAKVITAVGDPEGPAAEQALPIKGTVTKMPCGVRANYILTHGHPGGLLDHGICANRDAAREGRWDPDHPITRGVRK